jgi:RNA polymerase sigma factor (sigma-70 family)
MIMAENDADSQSDIDFEALRANDESAWTRFFEEFDPLITSVVRWSKWHFDHSTQDDMAQDIRAELLRCAVNFRADSSLRYFIKRICINRCIDRIRRQVRERAHVVSITYDGRDGETHDRDTPAPDSFDPVRLVVAHESAIAVKRLLVKLDTTCSDAIKMFYMKGMSYKDMAAHLNISTNTVGSRLAKCLEKLRKSATHDTFLGEEMCAHSDS